MKRILKNPLTSIAGLAIIGASIAYVLTKEGATWTEASVGITAGAVFLGVKDPSFSKKSNQEP